MQYDVRADLKDALKMLDGLQKDQIPFATAYALTQTAKAAQKDVEGVIRQVFSAPTPYTQKAVYVRPATKNRLFAQVKLKDESSKGVPAVRFLIFHITGGSRGQKGFENLLQRQGLLLPGQYAVPTRAAKLDAYGNVPRGTLNAILSQLQASRDISARETKKSKARAMKRRKRRVVRYFVAQAGRAATRHLAPGIYERVGFGFGDAIRPVFIFTERPPKYRKRFPFYETCDRAVQRELVPAFERGFKIAAATKGGTLAEQTEALFAAGIGDYMGGTRLPRGS